MTFLPFVKRDHVARAESAKQHSLSGYWSRRITDEQRFIDKVSEDAIEIVQLRYHY